MVSSTGKAETIYTGKLETLTEESLSELYLV